MIKRIVSRFLFYKHDVYDQIQQLRLKWYLKEQEGPYFSEGGQNSAEECGLGGHFVYGIPNSIMKVFLTTLSTPDINMRALEAIKGYSNADHMASASIILPLATTCIT